MNFAQIKKGNYSSIAGKWKLVAHAVNYYNGKGICWYRIEKYQRKILKITSNRIFMNKTLLVQHGKAIDNNDNKKSKRKLKFNEYSKANKFLTEKGILNAGVELGAVNLEYWFCPANVPITKRIARAHGHIPKKVNTKKDRILIFDSSMGSNWVFQRN